MTSSLASRVTPAPAYDASSITVLSGLESIRRRPAMYIGSTGADGLRHLVSELLDNAVDEVFAGPCDHIIVTLHEDGAIAVEDNGRGIPVEPHPTELRPACEVVLTTLHAGGKFEGGAYARSGGLHGIGLTCVCALSSKLELDVWRGGRHFQQAFGRGTVRSALQDVGPSTRTGTRIRFAADPEIFADPQALSVDALRERLHLTAFLCPGVTMELDDRRSGRRETFLEQTGLGGYVEHRQRGKQPAHARVIEVAATRGDVEVTAVLRWTRSYAEDVCSFVNGVHTSQGGTHVTGLVRGVARAIKAYGRARRMLAPDEEIGRADLLEGLGCVLSIRMSSPEFNGQAKFQLQSGGVTEIVEEIVARGLLDALERDAAMGAAIVGRVVDASRVRRAARRAGDQSRHHEFDPTASKAVYQKQFGIRSADWHESCTWIGDGDLLAAHAALCKVDKGARMLDVCCGSGVVGASFGDRVAHKTGLDLTAEMRQLARTRLDDVREGTVYAMPFEDDTFDITVTREVLHILPAPERPLAEIFRVLKPGGQLIFGQTVPYGDEDAAWMFRIFRKKQPLFVNNFMVDDYLRLLAAAGFVDVTTTDHFVWESIDRWIDTHETPSLQRYEIRDLFHRAPAEVREVHPFEVLPSGEIRDRWRWTIFSAFKPAAGDAR